MTRMFHSVHFYWILLTLLNWKITIQAEEHPSYVYSYCTNVTSVAENKALQTLCGQVTITPYTVGQISIPWTILTTEHKLLHVKATLGTNPKIPRYLLEAVACYNETNTVQWVYVPESRKVKTWELNHLKGILSLLIVHPSFQSGWETDSSGTCYTAYATVEDQLMSDHIVTVDKEKTRCERIQYPLDTWNHNAIPIQMKPQRNRMLVRYRFNNTDGSLVRAVAHEQQEIVLFKGLEIVHTSLASWQELVYLKQIMTSSQVVIELHNFTSEVTEKVAEQLTSSPNRIVHLGTLHPMEQTDVACSLNTNLYQPVGDQDDIPSDTDDDERLLPLLRNLIENARNSLHGDQLSQVESLHIVLQLIRLLRCLPNQTNVVDILNEATKMAPPGINTDILYRQYNTWRDQLVDVLVSCGTPTCTAVLLQRLEALTEEAKLTVTENSELTTEMIHVRKMLFITLWPALAHLRRTDNALLERLYRSCDHVTERLTRTICLTTIVNLYHTSENISENLENRLVKEVEVYLKIPDRSSLSPTPSLNEKEKQGATNKEASSNVNSRLLIGITLAKTLNRAQLFPSVSIVAYNTEHVSPTVRAMAIQTLPSLIVTADNTSQFGKINQLRHKLADLLIHSSNDTDNDLVIGIALFKTILSLYPSATELVQLVDQLAIQHRWSLVRSCRVLIDHACETEQLSEVDCECLKGHCPGFRSFGYAGGWSGLATGPATESGEATIIQGDLVNINDSLIVEYSLQLVNGPEGEFRLSNLLVELLNRHGATRLFEFQLHTEGMQVFSGMTSRRKKSSKTSSTSAWASVGLNYLQTRLPPWTVFTGGLQEMMQLLWSSPNQPTSILQVTQTAMDQRQHSVFGTGWVIRVDVLGLFAVRVDGALKSSIWSQSGYSLVRVRLGAVCELRAHVVEENFQMTVPGASSAMLVVRGSGVQSSLDFVTHVKVSKLPDGVCMAMNRHSDSALYSWNALHPVPDLWLKGRTKSTYRELQNPTDYQTKKWILPGTSYDLGRNNSMRCTNLASKTQW